VVGPGARKTSVGEGISPEGHYHFPTHITSAFFTFFTCVGIKYIAGLCYWGIYFLGLGSR
jgi:hypothetical protein